ncbi:MAG: hypothetical protein AMS25_14870 [Gemmatimonas sp. SM23_52]|jgi:hypothetical protein|nr:MAG: hypothetical protein AMS25_14870 [Gemmatimonas sp. SM23_52]
MNNEESVTPESVSTGAATPNLLQRVIMVFTAPGKLGEALRQTSPWFWTLAIAAIIATIAFFLLPPELMRQAMEAQAAQRPQGQEAPDPEAMLRIARIGGTLSVLVVQFIAAVVIAGALYLTFNVFMGQENSYKQYLSAAAHITWINLLGFLLVIPIWISKGDMRISLGLGLLLPDVPSSFGGHFLNSITIFGIWSAIALGTIESGLSGGRISAGKAVGTVLVLYLIWVLFSAARASIFGA